MGQLDEAIRAHLELKRKHGASEEELHAEEQEALGPVRREPVAPPPPEEELLGDLSEEHPPAAAPDLQVESLEELPPEAFHESAEPLIDPAAPAEVDFPEPQEIADPLEGSIDLVEEAGAMEGEDSAEPPDLPGPPEPPTGQTPPRGFPAIDEPGLEAEEDEDVLEETPDFLQETPEHDRLWFEQKPPRDFDFDE